MYYINGLDGKAKEFATACYEQNSIDELHEALLAFPEGDTADMKQWDITADEWRDAIYAAKHQLMLDSDRDRDRDREAAT